MSSSKEDEDMKLLAELRREERRDEAKAKKSRVDALRKREITRNSIKKNAHSKRKPLIERGKTSIYSNIEMIEELFPDNPTVFMSHECMSKTFDEKLMEIIENNHKGITKETLAFVPVKYIGLVTYNIKSILLRFNSGGYHVFRNFETTNLSIRNRIGLMINKVESFAVLERSINIGWRDAISPKNKKAILRSQLR